jgi:hypothetical protein
MGHSQFSFHQVVNAQDLMLCHVEKQDGLRRAETPPHPKRDHPTVIIVVDRMTSALRFPATPAATWVGHQLGGAGEIPECNRAVAQPSVAYWLSRVGSRLS